MKLTLQQRVADFALAATKPGAAVTRLLAKFKEDSTAEVGDANGDLLDHLVPLLRHPNYRVRSAACEIMASFPSSGAVPALLSVYDRATSRSTKETAERAILSLGTQFVPELLRGLSTSRLGCYPAARALERIGPDTVEALSARLTVPNISYDEGRLILGILQALGDKRAGAAVGQVYLNPGHVSRWQILEALGKTGAPDALAVVLHGMTDNEELCRSHAASAAGELLLREAIEQLLICANDAEPSVRRSAQAALERMGRTAKDESGAALAFSVTPLECVRLHRFSCIALDLRQCDLPDKLTHTFLIPLRPPDAHPLRAFKTRYLPVHNVELEWHRSDGPWEIIRSAYAPVLRSNSLRGLREHEQPLWVTPKKVRRDSDGGLRIELTAQDAHRVKELASEGDLTATFPWPAMFVALQPESADSCHSVDLEFTAKARTHEQEKNRPKIPITSFMQLERGPVDHFEIPAPYIGLTAAIASESWQSTEIAVIRRAFELGRLHSFRRGRNRHNIRVISPGQGLRGAELRDGLFERWMCAHAFQAHHELRTKTDTGGWLTSYFAFSEIPALEYSFLSGAANYIGRWLGAAVAIWNDLGELLFLLQTESAPMSPRRGGR